jgi:hypothetical protein
MVVIILLGVVLPAPAWLGTALTTAGVAAATWFFVTRVVTPRDAARRLPRRRIRRTCLGHGLCPSCQADLAGQPADGEGVTDCPECGSGWMLDHL